MSIPLHEKIRMIRESEYLSRTEFAEATSVSARTIEAIENKGNSPRSDVLEAIARKYPQYALWLITSKTNPPNHISPSRSSDQKIYRVFEYLSHPRPESSDMDLMTKPEWISQVSFLQVSSEKTKLCCLLTSKQQERSEIFQCIFMDGNFNLYSNAKGKIALRDLADFFIGIGREDLIFTSDLKVIAESSIEKIYTSWEISDTDLMIPDLSKASWLKEIYINFTAWRQQKKEYQPKYYEDDKEPENLWAPNDGEFMIYSKDEN